MKNFFKTTLLISALTVTNASALVKLSDSKKSSGKDFSSISEITDDKLVCIYVNRKYLPVTKAALKAANGKTCRSIGKVGVDYIGVNSSTRNAHLYADLLKQVQ